MGEAVIRQNVVLDLSNDKEGSNFLCSIEDALEEAKEELIVLNETIDSIKELKPQCDKLDYILAASSGTLCGLIDIFFVGAPGQSSLGNVTDKWIADKVKGFAKLFHPDHKDFDNLPSAIRFLENKFKVSYDQVGIGDAGREIFELSPKNHHFKSLSHNPSLLGLFFSILDQFDNTSHFITRGELIILKDAHPGQELQGSNIVSKVFCGFVNWIGHIMSDVSGASGAAAKGNRGMGIPSPLWTWTNDIIAMKSKLGINSSEIVKSINDLAITIYKNGYDVRYQIAQAIPVIINEMIIRIIYSIRRMYKYFSDIKKGERTFSLMWKYCEPFSNPTVKRMLTVAHGTFCLLDIGDATIRGFAKGNLNFNPVEFVMRINIVGIGRFAISLYGETKRAVNYKNKKEEAIFAEKKINIVNDYIYGLKKLHEKYNDSYILDFINDFKNSDAYKETFLKSVELAKLRDVPEDKILKTKSEIDKYFGGR